MITYIILNDKLCTTIKQNLITMHILTLYFLKKKLLYFNTERYVPEKKLFYEKQISYVCIAKVYKIADICKVSAISYESQCKHYNRNGFRRQKSKPLFKICM